MVANVKHMEKKEKIIDFFLSAEMSDNEFEKTMKKKLRGQYASYRILKKSLDARNKKNIRWYYKVALIDAGENIQKEDHFAQLNIPSTKNKAQVAVIGSGPAGLFAALCLLLSGCKVDIFERGKPVNERIHDINKLHQYGLLTEDSNYAFGEGGAGTFSDGKLSSRTKGIGAEKKYIIQELIQAGAPEEICYMAHPHVGSDNLFKIIPEIRKKIESLGGEFHFHSKMTDMKVSSSRINTIEINGKENIPVDYILLATGHSAYDTYRILIKKQVAFQNKNFAIGFRVEHPQELINIAQWGKPSLPGVKAAEYRLTYKDKIPVYSFCMCPGGTIIPSGAFPMQNIVNGMSLYERNGNFANAAIVAGIHIEKLLNKPVSSDEMLDWMQSLEMKSCSGNYDAPSASIHDFIHNKSNHAVKETSYPLNTYASDYKHIFPEDIHGSLKRALIHFNKELKGFTEGNIIGVETKTSSPLQIVRNEKDNSCTYPNLFFAGEGSGWAGGIISSATDGIKMARSIAVKITS